MTSNEQIEQLCIEARAHGLTYGEYVEKFKPKLSKPESKIKKNPNLRKCEMCGLLFTVTSGSPKYCAACVIDATAERAKARRAAQKGKSLKQWVSGTCEKCGKEFKREHGHQRFCDECKAEVRKRQLREAQKKFYAKKRGATGEKIQE